MTQRQPSRSHGDPAGNGAASDSKSPSDFDRLNSTVGPPPDLTSPQLTLRAVLTGMLLGCLFSACNVYVGLKIGSAPGMSLTAALLGYGFWRLLRIAAGSTVRPWGMLENNISQTACSSAASVASAGLVAPIPALTLLTGQKLPWHYLALWVFSVMLVGIVVAVALRRQMLVADKLRFPAGIASAEMLRELHSRGTEALARLKALASAALVAAVATLCATWKVVLPYVFPGSIGGLSARSLAFSLNPTLLPVGIGGLIGFRTCCSLLAGSIVAYAVLAPALVRQDYVQLPETVVAPLEALPEGVVLSDGSQQTHYDADRHVLESPLFMRDTERDSLLARSSDPEYREAVQTLHERSHTILPLLIRWLLWPGVSLIVVASIVSLCFSWRAIGAVVFRRNNRASMEVAESTVTDVTRRWLVFGLLVALCLSVALQMSFFGISLWAAILAVLLAFALAVVAARVSGETGISSVGAMGKVSQLVFGALVPKNPVPNLMAANVAGGAASQCADLLDDLKCGYLLGASPRRQTVAQICGALVGALAGSAAYLILIPDPAQQLFGEEWPAPAVRAWKAVAELFKDGFDALPKGTPTAMIVAALAGIALPTLERVAPRRLRPFVLSPVGLGLAFLLPASMAISIFIGGLAALLLGRWFKSWSARFLVAICVGLIAGESLTGIGVEVYDQIQAALATR